MGHKRGSCVSWLAALLGLLLSVPNGCALADTFQVTKTLDTRDGKCDADCSLREAIIAANQHPGPDTVMVPAGTYVLQQIGQEGNAAAGDLDILDDLTLTGAGAESTTIDAKRPDGITVGRVFNIHSGPTARLNGLTIQNGSDSSGGAIYNGGTLTLTNCTLSGNSAGNGGGAIYNSGTLTLTNCTLSGNLASNDGGAIYNSGELTLHDCTLNNNSGYGRGGAISNGGEATLTRCTLNHNSNGAIYNGGELTLQDCTLSRNSEDSAISNSGTLTLQDCTLSTNSGYGGGGAISNGGEATLTNCTLNNNSAGDYSSGGGIYNLGGTLTLTNCTLSSNSANGHDYGGGAIYNEASGKLTLTSCTLNNNYGYYGGGIYTARGGVLILTNCTLSRNSASNGGGGIYNESSGKLTLTSCTLSGNSASNGGGGIYNKSHQAELTLTSCTLSGNSGGSILGAASVANTVIANSLQGRNCNPPTTSNGYNLDDDGTCGFFSTGDLSIVPANLAPLGDYGGPTQTHALCSGPGAPDPSCAAASPAIDAGDNGHCPATDQRGAPRPYGSACDIGAYESGAQPPPTTPCVGDCDGSGEVPVNEVITLVDIALGNALPSACPHGVPSGAEVNVALIIQAVNNALNGCGVG